MKNLKTEINFPQKFRIRLCHLLLFVFLLVLDQITKYLAIERLMGQGKKIIIPKLLSLTYLENTGAVWGIFQDKTAFLIILTSLVFCLVLFFYFRIPMERRYLPIRLTVVFVAAGALGNILDRIRYGYVVDFLNFEFIDFPVFNVADIYITVSVFVILILVLFFYKEEEEQEGELTADKKTDMGSDSK